MPKPTNAALNVNDNFSGDNFNPQYGDVASQGQVTMKSDATSASAARPSRPAVVDAAAYTEGVTLRRDDAITVSIDGSGNFTCDPGPNVTTSGMVTLKYTGTGTVNVLTSQGNGPVPVFTKPKGVTSYPADGTTYKLDSKITGDITLQVVIPAPTASLLRDDDDDDDDDDGGDDDHHHHGPEGGTGTINVGN